MLVEVKYFLGLTDEEAAETLGVKLRTMQRMWRDVRQWLFEQHGVRAMPNKAQDDDLVISLVELALSPSRERARSLSARRLLGDAALFTEVWDYVQWEQRMNGFLLEPLYRPPPARASVRARRTSGEPVPHRAGSRSRGHGYRL